MYKDYWRLSWIRNHRTSALLAKRPTKPNQTNKGKKTLPVRFYNYLAKLYHLSPTSRFPWNSRGPTPPISIPKRYHPKLGAQKVVLLFGRTENHLTRKIDGSTTHSDGPLELCCKLEQRCGTAAFMPDTFPSGGEGSHGFFYRCPQ